MELRASNVGTSAPRVLVVEDDDALRQLIAMYLADVGFSVVEATTAEQAVTALRDDGAIALVFSDIQMPGEMNGVDLARWIARERPSLKVLLTSGSSRPAGGRRWPFVAKPYQMNSIERLLHDMASD